VGRKMERKGKGGSGSVRVVARDLAHGHYSGIEYFIIFQNPVYKL
jgi:hypothetical protein